MIKGKVKFLLLFTLWHLLAKTGSGDKIRVFKSAQRLNNADQAIDGMKLVYNENPKFQDFTLCMRFNFKSLYKDVVSIKIKVNVVETILRVVVVN